MTDSLAVKVRELKNAILDSEEYRNFDMYKRLLSETPELLELVNEFRKANYELQLSGDIADKDKANAIIEKYKDLFSDSAVTPFLNAELALCKMIQEINTILVEDVDLGLEFF